MLQTHQILFNALKHHLSYIRKEIGGRASLEELLPLIHTLGHSKMDMYTGNLSISKLFEEALLQIPSKDQLEFETWINLNDGFQKICLSDQSEWILRYALEKPKQFIHLHPGRYSPHTFRISATILKTAVLLVFSLKAGLIDSIDTKTINNIRVKYLKLSPIKNYNRSNQLQLIIEKLQQYE